MANLITQVKPYNASQQTIPDYGIRASAVQYGASSTAAGTGEKAVSCATFLSAYLTQGAIVAVKFDNTNSAAVGNLKLNVNNTGAKPIKFINNGTLSNLPSADYLKKDQIYLFYYDNNNWVILLNYDTNSETTVSVPATVPVAQWDSQIDIGTVDSTTFRFKMPATMPEAFLTWGGKNFSASYGPIDAAMIDPLGANRFAFLKAAGLTIEYSNDGGTTWTDYGATDVQKTGLFGAGQGFNLGKHSNSGSSNVNDQLRVTIATSAAGLYTVLNKIAIYMSTNGATVQVKMEKALESTPTTYTTHLDWTGISGWSGWNILNINDITTYGNTAASQYGRLRFTFKQTAVNSSYASASISRIMGFGGMGWTIPSNMARDGHLYSYDNSQNATFPAQVTATTFKGNLDWSYIQNKPTVDIPNDATDLSFGNESTIMTYNGTGVKVKMPAAPTQTHYTAKLFAGAANGTANATTTDGNTYLILTDNGANTSQVKLKSGGNTTITSDNAGVITIKSEDSFDGTVTQVTAGAGLNTTSNDTATDGGSITTSGTLYLTKSGVTAGTYQGITVDKYGRVTAASNQGYVKSSGVTSVQVKATSPVASSQSAAQTSTLTTTISLEDGYGDTQNPYDTKNPHYVLAGPSSGSGAAAAQKPTFRALVGNDLPLATNSAQGVIKPWYHHTAASTGPTTGSNATAVSVNAISTTAGKYYAIESDSNGRLFVNVPWTNTDNDTKVSQTDVVTPANWRKVLMGSQNSATKNVAVSDTTSGAFATNSFEYQPSTGTLRSKKYMVDDAVTLEYNATTKSLDFIFA